MAKVRYSRMALKINYNWMKNYTPSYHINLGYMIGDSIKVRNKENFCTKFVVITEMDEDIYINEEKFL